MLPKNSISDLEGRAIAALNAVLGQVSVIKLKEITREEHGTGSESNLIAHVEILGRSHTLACDLMSSIQPDSLRSSLMQMRDGESATRVVIAPHLSPEMQSLCKENRTGFLDLEGNARIALGEIFIGRRSLTAHGPDRVTAKPTVVAEAIKSLAPRPRSSGKPAVACQA